MFYHMYHLCFAQLYLFLKLSIYYIYSYTEAAINAYLFIQSWADANAFASSRPWRESILMTRNAKTRNR